MTRRLIQNARCTCTSLDHVRMNIVAAAILNCGYPTLLTVLFLELHLEEDVSSPPAKKPRTSSHPDTSESQCYSVPYKKSEHFEEFVTVRDVTPNHCNTLV